MTLDLSTTFPSAEAIAYCSEKTGMGIEEFTARSYDQYPLVSAMIMAIHEGSIDLFQALVDKFQQQNPLFPIIQNCMESKSLIEQWVGFDQHDGFNFYRIYGLDTPERHENFTAPAIRYLLEKNACNTNGINALISSAIEQNDLPIMQEIIEHIQNYNKRHKGKEIAFKSELHFPAMVLYERASWIPVITGYGYELDLDFIRKALEETRPEKIEKYLASIPLLLEHLPPEKREKALCYVNDKAIAQLLIESGIDPAWRDAKDKSVLMYLAERGDKSLSARTYLAEEYGCFHESANVEALSLLLGARIGDRLLNIIVKTEQDISPECFATCARIEGTSPPAFFAGLPKKIQNNPQLAAVEHLVEKDAAACTDTPAPKSEPRSDDFIVSGLIKWGNFRGDDDARTLYKFMTEADAEKLLLVMINGRFDISAEYFAACALITQKTPEQFYEDLPQKILDSKYLAAVTIHFIQSSAAKQAYQLGDTRDKAKHAAAERGGE